MPFVCPSAHPRFLSANQFKPREYCDNNPKLPLVSCPFCCFPVLFNAASAFSLPWFSEERAHQNATCVQEGIRLALSRLGFRLWLQCPVCFYLYILPSNLSCFLVFLCYPASSSSLANTSSRQCC
jgi:hypothetical protein